MGLCVEGNCIRRLGLFWEEGDGILGGIGSGWGCWGWCIGIGGLGRLGWVRTGIVRRRLPMISILLSATCLYLDATVQNR